MEQATPEKEHITPPSPAAEPKANLFDLPPLERVPKQLLWEERKPRRKGGRRNRPEAWKVLLAILICLLFAMASYFIGRVYGASLIPTDEPAFIPPVSDGDDGTDAAPAYTWPKILTVLVMGTDQRTKNELARADVIILAALNLETKKIDLLSIPRDTRAIIADLDKTQKINHAHATGGPERMVKTVERLLGVNVHYYMETNFQGFARCVDIIGGIDYNVERRMELLEEGINLWPGQQKLDGYKALQYVRWRGEPTADIGRVGRQQKFLKAALEQAINLGTLPKLPSLLGALRDNILTDMTTEQMLNLAYQFADVKQISLASAPLPGEGKTISGISYWVMDEGATQALLQGIFAPPSET
ncbi:MAG: LCP family protein, partial [Peptococcaceae bacterium]|nr:LCP family protein [Peptococcaceae bacterium]